jgi:hypothetical protein
MSTYFASTAKSMTTTRQYAKLFWLLSPLMTSMVLREGMAQRSCKGGRNNRTLESP